MIKEYFTDGLIGLAILLSLLRTDLLSLNLNNLINYPEVQDIILGQTAAYLPTNFHTIQQSRHSPSLKHIELDNDALTSWYQNVNNLFRFRQGRQNEIEAFLVSESHTPITESFTDNHSPSEITGNENVPQSSTQVDLVVDQNSLNAEASVTHQNQRNASTSNESVSYDNGGATDLTTLVNPFPECDLTREDLKLIEALWKQDVDLGVGREVYDPSLRQVLERERELELLKQKEKKKAQLAAREKEEKARQEKAGRWLKQNFRRDGETGEWVKVHNSSAERNNDTPVITSEDHNNESLTLEDALEYFSYVTESNFLNSESPDGQGVSSFQNLSSYELNPLAEFQNVQGQTEPQTHLFGTQDSFEESFNGLVDYLDMANNTPDSDIFAVGGLMADDTAYKSEICTPLELKMPPQVDHNSVLFQNASMPSPGIDVSNEFNISPAPCELNVSSVQQANALNNSIDLGLDNLDFFQDLPNLPEGAVDELDLDAADFLLDIDNTSSIMEDALDMPAYGSLSTMGSDNLNSSSVAMSNSPNQDLNEDFTGLEGATGGSNLTTEDFDGSYNKFSRLSESSSDSGIAFHGGFSSSSSSSSSSYAGSPASSHHGNGSIASNDTDHDPHKTGSIAHHVAHNHTYNTLPGQIPREVKKYAHKEPSRKGPQSRDQKRASEMKVPFSVDEIIESPVDTFNEMLTKHKLTESQLTLIRDIRRRGKNKVAAQNCRKRKVHVIVSLSDDLTDLEKARDKLRAEREEMEKETRNMKDRFSYLYTHIFQSLRDERGEPYDPNLYSLQQSSDGNVFLVPRNTTTNQNRSETGDRASRKRKAPES